MKSEYRSPKSVAKNQTIPIDAMDPRLKRRVEGITRARAGAEIQVIGKDVGSSIPIIQYGSYISSDGGKNNPVPGTWNKEEFESTLRISLGPISNLVVAWDTTPGSQDDLLFEFDFDTASAEYPDNKYATGFSVRLVTAGGVDGYSQPTDFKLIPGLTHHSYRLTKAINQKMMNGFATELSSFCVTAIDNIGVSIGPEVCIAPPEWLLTLEVPLIEVTSLIDGYGVKLLNTDNLTNPQYGAFEVWEVISNDESPPTDGWSKVWQSPVSMVKIGTLDLSTRWVKARFVSTSAIGVGRYTDYSIAYKVTPMSGQGVDTQPPNEVIINSVTWDVDDIVINYSLPEEEEANQFQIVLTAPNTEVGFFYDIPTYHNTTDPQEIRITKDKIYAQFGAYFSSYTGVMKSIDTNGNRSNGISITVPLRPNPLLGVVPVFELQALTNGYSVSWVQPAGASYADVYELLVPWTTDPIDESDRVYAGRSPAYVITDSYDERYIKIRYYDDYGNTSEYSSHTPQRTVIPIDPGALSIINNPVTFSTEGSILAGSSPTLGARAIFNKDGFFIYDGIQAAPSTQIVGNASDGMPTFITEQAKIANWTITPSKIENLDFGSTGTYTGLSPSGTYAFWAGSPIAGGDNLAKFWVKPDGTVRASNISIVGGDLDIGGIFKVTSAGKLTASDADIIGNITATTGTFKGNVEISSAITNGAVGSLYSGALTAPDVNGISVISGDGFILNKLGMSFFNAGSRKTFISNNILSAYAPGTLVTTQAYIANWEVTATEIRNIGINGSVFLKAGNVGDAAIYGKPANGQTSAGILAPRSSDGEFAIALWAGKISDPALLSTTGSNVPGFYVTYGGKLFATGAEISGLLKSESIEVTAWNTDDSENPVIGTGSGYYFDPRGTGSFALGAISGGGSLLSLSEGQLNIRVKEGGSFTLGTSDGQVLTYSAILNQLRLSLNTPLGTNTEGLYFDNVVNDDYNWGKNDPIPVISDGLIESGLTSPRWIPSYDQVGKIVKGRRLYWGFSYTPPGVPIGTNASADEVAGIDYAEAGDFFFSSFVG